MNKKQKKMLSRILSAAAIIILLKIFDARLTPWFLKLALYMIPYLIVGGDVLRKALHGIKHRQVFDENFLMAVATIGAIFVGTYNGIHGMETDYLEAVAVMLLYQTGELFQSIAVGRSRRNIAALMDIRPDVAYIVTEDGREAVDPDEVEIGTVIQVNPGEKIPLDGIVEEGESSLDTAALTGESRPRDVAAGDEVLSGCINRQGSIRIRTTKEFDESTASRILELVENAASRKSKSEQFISRFARVYTPIVCYSALALAVLPPVILALLGRDPLIMQWIYRACTFLVISCPCALVISIPLSFFAGLGAASSSGVLIKGSNYLEALSEVRTLVMDKTGTLTKGNFAVTEICPSGIDADRLLYLAAHLEGFSTHPIAVSLREAWGKEPDTAAVKDIEEIFGKGITGCVDGIRVYVGNHRLLDEIGMEYTEPDGDGSIIHVCADGNYAGYVRISDEIREETPAALSAIRNAGVKKLVMLTGDAEAAAAAVAKKLGIREYRSGLLPEGKVACVEELINDQPAKEKLAFVGDGINDAPVLSRADVGIAMGALGSDAAIEAADVVLMDDDPRKIAKAIRISGKCLRIVWQNIIFAIGVKVICLLLGALGIAGMWAAIFADVGVMIICVINAMRALLAGR